MRTATLCNKLNNESWNVKKYIFILVILAIQISLAFAVEPFGATPTIVSSSRATPDSAQSVNAQAGNTTEINIFGYTITQSWQGYFGNVTGTLELGDSSDHVMYNWSLASPKGEIYASNASSINWTNISCFNVPSYSQTVGASWGIGADDVDSINNTFQYHDHPLFYTNNKQFSAGQCNNTKLYNSSGAGTFYEVLMTDTGTNLVFTSMLQQDVIGFDTKTHDFEMLVLENGHGTDTAVTPYYFYVELE